MNDNKWTTLSEVSEATGLTIQTLTKLADEDGNNPVLSCHLKAAETFGFTVDEWIRGLLGTN